MADNILKQNKIPGREQLTRPDEISALSKYLGGIKEIQDEHTKLDKRTLEVRGRGNSAYFPEIEGLDNRREDFITEGLPGLSSLDSSTHSVPKNEIPEVTSLDNTVIKGDMVQGVESLDDSTSPLSDNVLPEVKTLDDSVIPGADNTLPSLKKLDESLTKLSDTEEKIKTLDSSVTPGEINLGKNVKALDNSSVNLVAKEKISKLDSTLTDLNPGRKVESLDENREALHVSSGPKNLDKSLTGLSGNLGGRVRNLSEELTGITGNFNEPVENLDSSLTGIAPGEGSVDSLEDYVENLNVTSGVIGLDSGVEPGILGINEEPERLDNSLTKTPWNFTESPVDLDNSTEGLEVNPLVKMLSGTRENLKVENKISKLSEGILGLNAEDKVKGLDNYLEELGAEDCVADLDDTLVKIKINNLVHALRDDKSELEVEALIKDLSRFVLLGIPYDRMLTEIKSLLLNSEGLDIDQAFNKVISVFSNFSKENPEFSWLEKITGLLSQAIYSRKPENDPKHRNDLPTGSSDMDRSRYEIFSKKLEEITETTKATALKSIAKWEAETVSNGKQKNRLTDLSSNELLESGYVNSGQGDLNSLKETIKRKREIQAEVGKDRDYKNVPDFQLPDSRNIPLSNIGFKKSLKSNLIGGLGLVANGINGLNGIDYARLGIEKLLKEADGVSNKFKKGSKTFQLLWQSLKAAAESIYIAKWTMGMESDRLPGTAYSPKVAGRSAQVGRVALAALKTVAGAMTNPSTIITSGISQAVKLIQKKNSKHNPGRGTNRPYPVNRPNTNQPSWKDNQGRKVVPTEVYENAGGRFEKKTYEKKEDSVGDVFYRLFVNLEDKEYTETKFKADVEDPGEEINFQKNYMSSEGIQTTLRDLCNVEGGAVPSSFDELKTILRNSPYITTPDKFTNTNNFTNNVQTLPVTNYWEIIIEPFVNDEMNGGFSYLPAIQEINLINEKKHGVFTGYNHWLPFTGFELSMLKMGTKTAGLFEGEIVYPIAAEEVNDLRITMVDDMYRSWSWYWKTVMEVSVFNSIPHDKYYYEGTSTNYPIAPTYVDHTIHSVALYKNITFRIKIYIMTPQYSTIKNFDLLCVLKDWSDSYSGDVDTGGGGDISLSFCVVGENPDKHTKTDLTKLLEGMIVKPNGTVNGIENRKFDEKGELIYDPLDDPLNLRADKNKTEFEVAGKTYDDENILKIIGEVDDPDFLVPTNEDGSTKNPSGVTAETIITPQEEDGFRIRKTTYYNDPDDNIVGIKEVVNNTENETTFTTVYNGKGEFISGTCEISSLEYSMDEDGNLYSWDTVTEKDSDGKDVTRTYVNMHALMDDGVPSLVDRKLIEADQIKEDGTKYLDPSKMSAEEIEAKNEAAEVIDNKLEAGNAGSSTSNPEKKES